MADQFDLNMQQYGYIETPYKSIEAVAKTVNNPTPNVGDTTDYTITLANNGSTGDQCHAQICCLPV